MLKWTVLSFVLALLTGWLAFKVLVGAVALLVKLVFVLMVVLFLVSVFAALRGKSGGTSAGA